MGAGHRDPPRGRPHERTAADLAPGPKGQPGAVGRSGRPGRAQEEAGHREPLQAHQPPWPRGGDTGTSPTSRLSPPDSSLRTSTPERTASPQPSGPLLTALPDAPEGPVRTGSQSWDQLRLPPSTPPRTAAEPEGPRTGTSGTPAQEPAQGWRILRADSRVQLKMAGGPARQKTQEPAD